MGRKNSKGIRKPKMTVLSDHKKVGKKFVPPMQQLGPWKDANWLGTVLPELLWIGLLNQCYGFRDGAELSLALARAATQATGIEPKEFKKKFGKGPKKMFGAASAYRSLSPAQRRDVIDRLEVLHHRGPIIDALSPLFVFYSKCPLNFLFEGTAIDRAAVRLEGFKDALSSFFDKYDIPATFMMATAVYIAFCTNKMRVVVSDNRDSDHDSALANLPAIKDYPNTEEARIVGGSIRNAANMLVVGENPLDDWPACFWNCGLELERCDYERIYQQYE
jgi:hypothetical protein